MYDSTPEAVALVQKALDRVMNSIVKKLDKQGIACSGTYAENETTTK